MGRLAGFRYRQIIKRLKAFGFAFDRQAAGSHEIWYNSQTNRYTTIPNHSHYNSWHLYGHSHDERLTIKNLH